VALATVDPQYRAATEDVALLDRSQAGKLALSGPGAIAFLDSVLSNDVAALSAGSGQEAALLTHNGRMLAQVRVLRSDEELLLDTERVALQALFDALQQFRLGYDAELHKRTLQCGLLSLIGPPATVCSPRRRARPSTTTWPPPWRGDRCAWSAPTPGSMCCARVRTPRR